MTESIFTWLRGGHPGSKAFYISCVATLCHSQVCNLYSPWELGWLFHWTRFVIQGCVHDAVLNWKKMLPFCFPFFFFIITFLFDSVRFHDIDRCLMFVLNFHDSLSRNLTSLLLLSALHIFHFPVLHIGVQLGLHLCIDWVTTGNGGIKNARIKPGGVIS